MRKVSKTIRQKYIDALHSPKRKQVGDWRTDKSKIGHGVCAYCGHYTSVKAPYCPSCEREGFAEVHRMFGKTNGWDRRPIRIIPVKNGWRGRVVSGSRSQMIRA